MLKLNSLTSGYGSFQALFSISLEVEAGEAVAEDVLDKGGAEILEAVRAERDSKAVESALATLESAARGTENIMPALVDAVGKYTTLGEICGVLQGVFGEYRAGESL